MRSALTRLASGLVALGVALGALGGCKTLARWSQPADADRDVMRRELRQNPRGNFLVLDEAHQLAGVLTLEDMKVLLFGEDDDRDQAATAGDLMHVSHATLTPEDDLATALERMEDCDDDFLPVVRSAEDRRIAGVIKQRDLTLAHNRALAEAGMEARGST